MATIIAPAAAADLPRFETHLHGGLAAGFRNDPEGPLAAAVRTASDNTTIIELEVDAATSGYDNVAWITLREARAFALAILNAVDAAEAAEIARLNHMLG